MNKAALEKLMQRKLAEDGKAKAAGYVEMAEVVQPEHEQERGASKDELKARMKRLSEHGSKGFSTSGSASIRDLGFAMSSARGSTDSGGRLSVKDIAKRADFQVTRSRSASASSVSSSSSKLPATAYSRDAASTEAAEAAPAASPAAAAAARPGSKFRAARSMSVGAHPRHMSTSSTTASTSNDDMPVLNVQSIKLFLQQENKQQQQQHPASPLVVSSKSTTATTSPPPPSALNKFLSSSSSSQLPHSSPLTTSAPSLVQQPPSPSVVSRQPNARPSQLTQHAAAELERAAVDGKQQHMASEQRKSQVRQEVKVSVQGKHKASVVQQVRANGNRVDETEDKTSVVVKLATVQGVVVPVQSLTDSDARRRYTLQQLTQRPFPVDVDPFAKEDWLLLPEFVAAFGLLPAQFAKLPTWKKVEMRKQAKIF